MFNVKHGAATVAVALAARLLAAAVALFSLPSLALSAAADESPLDEIVISANLRATALSDVARSVTVLGPAVVRAAGVQHLADVLALIPGLSWASGTSRPRYFQLRGVGESEQYQGAPNPSVGFLIDDIDFSGVGMPATLFDLERIEVLRGPAGTVYGANALAGLIDLRSRNPGTSFDLRTEVSVGDYGTQALGLALGDGRADGTAGWRVAAQRFVSNGFRRNVFLGRNDTNGYDESTLRGKLIWQPLPALHAALTLLHADLDNGYDAWSVDNSLLTRTNQPGRDAQRSSGAALRLSYQSSYGEWLAISNGADSHIDYSFDGDWGNDLFWGASAPYNYFEQHLRERRSLAQDLRLIGNDMELFSGQLRPVIGAYLSRLRESDIQYDGWNDQYYGVGSSRLSSRYAATNAALYGSLELRRGAHTTWQLGLRAEQRTSDYDDTADPPFPRARDTMLGGNLSWSHHSGAARQHYATLSRGYKAGGYNIGAQIEPLQRHFRNEALWNLELGVRGTLDERRIEYQADVYAMRREHMQVYNSRQLNPNNPLTYVFFTANAARGDNIGLEGELRWRLGSHWQLAGSLALQRTRLLAYQLDGAPPDGRAQAFAPAYQASLAATWQDPQGAFARFDLAAQARYYFSNSHDQQAGARLLCNLRVGWRRGSWTTSFWVRNLLDRRYAVQGFYFGDEPPDFPVKLYLQNGDPRQLGWTLSFAADGG
ncbi:MAG: TonB-dependent receptor plug domain-containing protein [Steroidobacteraceae bacterium]